jgi:hypothetical protein
MNHPDYKYEVKSLPAIGDKADSGKSVIGQEGKIADPVIGESAKTGEPVIGQEGKIADPVIGDKAASGKSVIDDKDKAPGFGLDVQDGGTPSCPTDATECER